MVSVIRQGSRGPDVVAWQSFLIQQGLLASSADGIFDAKTDAATRNYQAREGLKVDGAVGQKTLAKAKAQGQRVLRRVRSNEVTPEMTAQAKTILKAHWQEPFGSEFPFELSGKKYVARIEQHYHPPGGSLRPWGYHAGVSLLIEEQALTDGMVLDDQTEDGGERESPIDPAASTTTLAEQAQFKLSARSLARLDKVHPDLVRVVKRAIQITGTDFTVVEGIRTLERQKALLASGATQTLHSRHLTGHAVDLAPWIGNQVSWHWPQFDELAKYIKRAAADEHVPIEWGGDWTSFRDGPHWQLPVSVYPA